MKTVLSVTLLLFLSACATAPTNPPRGPLPPAVELAPGDAQPVPTFMAQPQYPKEFAEKKIPGTATVDFIVEADGSVQMASAIKQTNEAFGEAAVACVKKWKFKPGIKAGVPVRTHLQVPIVFGPR